MKPRWRLAMTLGLLASACGSHEPGPKASARLVAPAGGEVELAESLGPREAQVAVEHLSASVSKARVLLEQVESSLGDGALARALSLSGSAPASEAAPAPGPDPAKIKELLARLDASIAVIDEMEAGAIARGEELAPYLWDQREQLKASRQAIRFPVTELYLAQECDFGAKCQGNNPGWARYLLGSDLAEERLKVHFSRLPPEERARIAPRIAVVDSGFDWEGHKYSLKAISAETFAGHDKADDAAMDPNGHGTAVAGMIFGALTGVTEFAHLRSYRVTEPGRPDSVSSQQLSAAVIKACGESDVVNVSWGTLWDELGYADLSKEPWYQKARDLGCVVVKASGNEGFKSQSGTSTLQSASKPDSPVLLAGALNEFGSEASFSTRSLYLAPGQGVYTLMSKQVERLAYEKASLCTIQGQLIGPISGTSFASPYLAGISGQIIAMLKARGTLPTQPVQKLILVRKILDGAQLWSEWAGRNARSVNALAAVRIAERYSGEEPGSVSPLRLFETARDEYLPQCSEALPRCEEKKFCYSKRNCVNRVRERDFLCRNESQDSRAYLVGLLRELQEPQLIASLLDSKAKGGADPVLSDLEELWDKNISEHSRKIPPLRVEKFETAVNILESAVKAGVGRRFVTAERALMVISSYGFSSSSDLSKLAQGDLSGGGAVLLDRFVTALSYADPDSLARFLEPSGAVTLGASATSEELRRLSLLHLLSLRKASFPEELRRRLDAALASVGRKLLDDETYLAQAEPEQLEKSVAALAASVRALGLGRDELLKRARGAAGDFPPLVLLALKTDILSAQERRELARDRLLNAPEATGPRGVSSRLSKLFEHFYLDTEEGDLASFLRIFSKNPSLRLGYAITLSLNEKASAVVRHFNNDRAFREKLAAISLSRLTQLMASIDSSQEPSERDSLAYIENAERILFDLEDEKGQWPMNKALFLRFKGELAGIFSRAAETYSRETSYRSPLYWMDYGLRRMLEARAKDRRIFEAWKQQAWLREQLAPLRGQPIKDEELKKWVGALFAGKG